MNYEVWIAAQAVSGQNINGIHQRNLFYTGNAPLMNNHQHLQIQMIGAVIPGPQGAYSQMMTQQTNAHLLEQLSAQPFLPVHLPSTPSTAQSQSITFPDNNMFSN